MLFKFRTHLFIHVCSRTRRVRRPFQSDALYPVERDGFGRSLLNLNGCLSRLYRVKTGKCEFVARTGRKAGTGDAVTARSSFSLGVTIRSVQDLFPNSCLRVGTCVRTPLDTHSLRLSAHIFNVDFSFHVFVFCLCVTSFGVCERPESLDG